MNKLYILCGIPFSGKSYLAKAIALQKNFSIIDLDEVKFQLYGRQIKDSDLQQTDWDKIYQEMYKQIEDLLKAGKTVLHDTGNFTKSERELVKRIADSLNLSTIFIYVNTPIDIARARLLENRKSNKRFDVSDKDFESTVVEMEIPTDDNVLTFNYMDDLKSWIDKNLE